MKRKVTVVPQNLFDGDWADSMLAVCRSDTRLVSVFEHGIIETTESDELYAMLDTTADTNTFGEDRVAWNSLTHERQILINNLLGQPIATIKVGYLDREMARAFALEWQDPLVEQVVAEVDEAFSDALGRAFPDAISGDWSPENTVSFQQAVREATVEWLGWNHPDYKFFSDDEKEVTK